MIVLIFERRTHLSHFDEKPAWNCRKCDEPSSRFTPSSPKEKRSPPSHKDRPLLEMQFRFVHFQCGLGLTSLEPALRKSPITEMSGLNTFAALTDPPVTENLRRRRLRAIHLRLNVLQLFLEILDFLVVGPECVELSRMALRSVCGAAAG